MLSNHLIIGLGGSGGKILRSFRKQIYQQFRAENPSGVNVRYLYVDSSDEMMGYNDPTWRILGQNVQLPKTSQLLISGLNLSQVIDNLASYPGVSPWLGSKENFRSILTSSNAANVVGGQKRRLGRFLFACLAHKYVEQAKALVKEMETGGLGSCTFHVCCGLAGGTGSGSIVDAISQLRTQYPGKQYKIIVYALLPDKNPGPNRALANYHANGYAALTELNALSLGLYKPWDVTGTKRERLDLQDPFNCCYLFTDENEDHNKVDTDRELPDIVSSFLYQKIVAAKDMKWDSLNRLETFENMDFRPEESPSGGSPERSRLFFAFGVKQIAYPEEEIREYLTYAFARQASLQLQYNRWSDGFGYMDEAMNQSFGEFVRAKETQQRWLLSDEHLCLSEGILPDEIKNKRWKPINAFWGDLIPNFKGHIQETMPKTERAWLDELSKLCEQAYGQNYRDLGVRKFYETKLGEMKDHVREVRGRVEADLFQDWVNGAQSMFDISRLLQALTQSLEERLSTVDDKIARMKDNEGQAQGKVSANAAEYSKLGALSITMGKHKNLLNAQGECMQQLYIYRTRLEGLQYSKRLIQSLIAEFTLFASEVGRASSMIAESLKEFTNDMNERCNDSGHVDLDKQVIRFYQPTAVKDFTRALVLDRPTQAKQTGAVRNALVSLLGENQNFGTFNTRIGRDKFISVLETICERNAIEAHNTHVAASAERSRILEVSIVERLYREYGGNPEALRAYVMSVVSRAKSYLGFNDAEVKRQGPGTLQGGFFQYLSIIVPEAPELQEFRQQLMGEFRNATPGAKDEVTSRGRSNEITLVSLRNLFPLRYVADVQFLKERYDQRLGSDNTGQAKTELHTEGDGSQFPSLFIESVDSKKYLAYLMTGRAMGLLDSLEDPETGQTAIYLMGKDSRGRDLDPVPLGKDFAAILDEASLTAYDSLMSQIRPLLENQYLHKAKREELLNNIDAQVAAVKVERKNPLDKVYKSYVVAAQTAEAILMPKQ
jgi:hypothetical protein